MDAFYRKFEDRFRGSRELVRTRLEQYLPFLMPVLSRYPNAQCVDIGCGRGEWLEYLATLGFDAQGFDLDPGMLLECHDRGLKVTETDGIAFMKTLPDASQALVSAFHVVEHITFDNLRTLVQEAHRILKPGGLLILETPNPDNITMATRDFYLDPSHIRPIPPQLLNFVAEYYSFGPTVIVPMQEAPYLRERNSVCLLEVIGGASPDYAIVARKSQDEPGPEDYRPAFERKYGLSTSELSRRFDAFQEGKHRYIGRRLNEIQDRMETHYDTSINSLEVRIQKLEEEIEKINSSPCFCKKIATLFTKKRKNT